MCDLYLRFSPSDLLRATALSGWNRVSSGQHRWFPLRQRPKSSPAIIFPMDIRAGIIATVIVSFLGALWILRSGFRTLRSARRLTFYRIKRQRLRGGWYTVGVGLLFLAGSVFLALYGQPVAYRYFPPSPTITITPTIKIGRASCRERV